MNHIEDEEFILAIEKEVRVDFYKLEEEPKGESLCHLTRIGKYYKPQHLEIDHPGKEDLEREVPNMKETEKREKGTNVTKFSEEEDKVLAQLKRLK